MVDFSPEIVEAVCEELTKGKSLRRIERMEGMPTMSGIMKWLAQGDAYKAAGEVGHPKALFVEQYARALLVRADSLFEETLDISDDNECDSYLDDEGKTIYNLDHIQRTKLRVDTRKWMVGKMNPKKYGDKQFVDGRHEHNGNLTATITVATEDKKKRLEEL